MGLEKAAKKSQVQELFRDPAEDGSLLRKVTFRLPSLVVDAALPNS
jgi:hypothetical protein